MQVVNKRNDNQADARRMLVDIVQRIDLMNLISMHTFWSNRNECLQAAHEAS